MAAWLAATLIWAWATGALPNWMTALVPALSTVPTMGAALLAFCIGATVLVFVIYVSIALRRALRNQPAEHP